MPRVRFPGLVHFLLLFKLTVTVISVGQGQGEAADSQQLKYVWGDALDDPLASGPNGEAYPWDLVSKIATKQRNSRSMLFPAADAGADPQLLQNLISPQETRQLLLNLGTFTSEAQAQANEYWQYSTIDGDGDGDGYSESKNPVAYMNTTATGTRTKSKSSAFDGQAQGRGQKQQTGYHRKGRASLHTAAGSSSGRRRNAKVQDWKKQQRQDLAEGCVPSRLCASTYNTTAPLYGISLTSGKPVTIVQKFPDLLQQVVFQVCKQTECEVLQGECIQTYLPYLFLVLPLGPVTLTGQDYILVESGCVCQPKYARKLEQSTAPLPSIQPLDK